MLTTPEAGIKLPGEGECAVLCGKTIMPFLKNVELDNEFRIGGETVRNIEVILR